MELTEENVRLEVVQWVWEKTLNFIEIKVD